ncbi:hypothetical protein ABKN59_009814 [Abortiporus biennis]
MSASKVDLLILGAGWTSTFLIPLCHKRQISFAATSRPGSHKPDTIPFEFDPHSDDITPFEILPDAKTVLITFPIKVKGASERLVRLYQKTRQDVLVNVDGGTVNPAFIQLGSTGIWDGGPTIQEKRGVWIDRHSVFDISNDRAAAEEELLKLAPSTPTTVLNLCGLWGGMRSIKNIVPRVATSKELLRNKGSIHMIHGEDVSRAILAVHEQFNKANGERWILTDGRVYDWWDIAAAWGGNAEDHSPQAKWVRELMIESDVRALPRSVEVLGKGLDGRDFWVTFGLDPVQARLG